MTVLSDNLLGFQIVFNRRVFVVFCILVVSGMAFGFAGCKKADGEPGGGPDQSQTGGAASNPKCSLPIQRILTDRKGRKVAVTIVKRTPTHIGIIRKADRKSFDLAVEKLAEADRLFVEQLPIAKVSGPSNFVANRQAEISKLETEIQQHNSALASGTLNGSQTSMTYGKIERLNQEILKLRKQIAEYGR